MHANAHILRKCNVTVADTVAKLAPSRKRLLNSCVFLIRPCCLSLFCTDCRSPVWRVGRLAPNKWVEAAWCIPLSASQGVKMPFSEGLRETGNGTWVGVSLWIRPRCNPNLIRLGCKPETLPLLRFTGYLRHSVTGRIRYIFPMTACTILWHLDQMNMCVFFQPLVSIYLHLPPCLLKLCFYANKTLTHNPCNRWWFTCHYTTQGYITKLRFLNSFMLHKYWTYIPLFI